VQFLVEQGIDDISLNPDTMLKTSGNFRKGKEANRELERGTE
jgi:hypothetical protein